MLIKRILTIIFLLVTTIGSAHANSPESGVWWNPSEAGRGYTIEIQDNKINISAYVYDNKGQQVWYYSSGEMTSDTFYSGRVIKTVNGSCIGCAQASPQSIDVGSLSITFNGGKDATLTILGFTTQITRFDFAGGDNTHYPNACYGEWSGVFGSPSYPVYYGERISFTKTYTGSDGTQYLQGNRTGSSDIALCKYDPVTQYWFILLDSSTLYYRAFSFRFTGFNRMEGTHWTYLKTDTLSGNGDNWVAFRTASKNFVQGGNGPRTAKSVVLNPATAQAMLDLRLSTDKYMSEISKQGRPVLPAIQNALTKSSQAMSAIQKK